MNNILHEKPDENITGHRLYCVSLVDNQNINDKKILDIGCGFGWCELNFLKRKASHITCTEISDHDLETIRKYVKNPKVKTVVASALDLPFPDNSFDTVVSWEVIEHIPVNTEDKMFTEIFRVLKPGGVFYLSTPFSHFLSKLFDPAWWLIGHRHYSKERLVRLGLAHKLNPEIIKIKGGIWEVIFILDLYFSKWLLRRKPLFSDFLNKKVNIEYKTNGFVGIFVKYQKVNK